MDHGEASSFGVLANDYMFHRYSTLSILSIAYALIQGACVGVSVGGVYETIRLVCLGGLTAPGFLMQVGTIAVAFVAIVILRILIESYAVIYKTAQDLSDLARRF